LKIKKIILIIFIHVSIFLLFLFLKYLLESESLYFRCSDWQNVPGQKISISSSNTNSTFGDRRQRSKDLRALYHIVWTAGRRRIPWLRDDLFSTKAMSTAALPLGVLECFQP
jgi:hypothetical protein